MNMLIVRMKVRDYDHWKRVFDETEGLRKDFGLSRGWLGRDGDDRSQVVVVFQCEDLVRARQLMQSQEVKDAMQRGGVEEQPEIIFLEDVAEVGEELYGYAEFSEMMERDW